MMISGAKLLVLEEPTNNLDLASVEKLEEALLARRPGETNEATWLTARANALRPAYARLAFLWQQWGTTHKWRRESAKHGITLTSGPLTLARIGKLILRRQADTAQRRCLRGPTPPSPSPPCRSPAPRPP